MKNFYGKFDLSVFQSCISSSSSYGQFKDNYELLRRRELGAGH